MKKLIALFAVSSVASTAAVAGIALSGTASVSYDDNGSAAASSTSYDADLLITGTTGSTTVSAGYDMEGASLATTSTSMTTTIGPVTVTADMHDVNESNVDDGDGDYIKDVDDTSVSVTLDAPIGDATIGLDDDGAVTVSGTWSGVTVSHNVKTNVTTGSAAIAGMDMSVTNDDGSSTWSLGTTVSGVALTLDSEADVTAVFGLAGNTMTVSHIGERAATAESTDTDAATAKYSTASAAAYSTVAISRALTSGATLAATYKSSDESLTLKASVAF
ncbi:MAG: hypothetical protein HN470_04695 [Nitrosomonadales bacterium]|nr:hypothetical protein [Nitrosomonadales bacterium]